MLSEKECNEFLEEMVFLYRTKLFKTARRRMGNIQDAEDVLGELWTITTSKVEDLYVHPNKIAWLYECLRICIRRYNAQGTSRIQEIGPDGIKCKVQKKIDIVSIDDCNIKDLRYNEKYYDDGPFNEEYLAFLTQRERNYLKYKYMDGLNPDEIAKREGTTYSTITNVGSKAMKKLKKYFKVE